MQPRTQPTMLLLGCRAQAGRVWAHLRTPAFALLACAVGPRVLAFGPGEHVKALQTEVGGVGAHFAQSHSLNAHHSSLLHACIALPA
jgi:hypothetical protein